MKSNFTLPACARLLAVTCLLSLTGCSTFNHDWKQVAARPVTADGLEGQWQGYWLSDVNGHTGKLRCLVTKDTSFQYEFRYWATFWKVFRATYTTHLHVRKVDDGYEFRGEEDLGRFVGGIFQYEGKVSGTNFFSTYSSRYDHGTFRLTRP